METFQEKFCQAEKCDEKQFKRRLFWRCLHRHAIPLAPVILVMAPRYFSADRELIDGVRHAHDMSQVWEEIRQYFTNPRHTGWLRRRGNVRLSAHRLIQIAKQYLPSSGRPPRIGLPEN